MVQGKVKLQKRSKPARVTKKQQNPRKAAPKVYKTKQEREKISSNLLKKQNSDNLSNIERLVASKVGHLELIKGSRRQIEAKQKQKLKATK